MNKIVLIFGLLFLSLTLSAQKDFRRGFVITNEGDTLHGFVEYKFTGKLFSSVGFRSVDGATEKTYQGMDLKLFEYLDDKSFVSKRIEGQAEPVFGEVLIRGPVNLYRFGPVFYVEKENLYKLEESTDVYDKGANSYEVKKQKYIGILNFVFLDCSSMKHKVNRIRLSERDLVEAVRAYNTCSGQPSQNSHSSGNAVTASVFISGGAMVSSLGFSVGVDKVSMREASPTVSVGAEFLNRRSLENLSFLISVGYSSHSYEHTEGRQYGGYSERHQQIMSFKRVAIPVGAKYMISSGKIAPYAAAGYSFNRLIDGKFVSSDFVKYSTGDVNESVTTEKMPGISLHQMWLAVGVQKKFASTKLFVEVRGDGLIQETNLLIRGETNKAIVMDEKSLRLSATRFMVGFVF